VVSLSTAEKFQLRWFHLINSCF